MTPLLSHHLPALSEHYIVPEDWLVPKLIARLHGLEAERQEALALARHVVEALRAAKPRSMDINQLLVTYQLTSEEGVALMCVAEGLLRIPDGRTRDALIRDKMSRTAWDAADGNLFQNFSAWALNITGSVLHLQNADSGWGIVGKAVARLGEPVIRAALEQAMRIMGDQFVLGESIEKATARAARERNAQMHYSYDMLGEGARTAGDAARYLAAYAHAIQNISGTDGISIKLSALHPRYDWRKPARVRNELFPAVLKLCMAAKTKGIMLTIDAEEADRLVPSLELLEMLSRAPELAGWNGMGLAVQAYGRRAIPVLEYVIALARETHRRIPVRLVKGAYWDSEIKRAQVEGHADYSVFTRKTTTDLSYLAAARLMLSAPDAIFPQFATHNAMTAAMIIQLAGDHMDFEFQRLHGMGDGLYEALSAQLGRPVHYRIYAPVGPHHDLLAYLVRRLLENGSNSSFVYQIADKNVAVERLLLDPLATTLALPMIPNPAIPLPPDLYGDERKNARCPVMPENLTREAFIADVDRFLARPYAATSIIGGKNVGGEMTARFNPADHRQTIGMANECTPDDAARALTIAHSAQHAWDALGAAERGAILKRAANLFEKHLSELTALVSIEGGRTIVNAIHDVREAIDFLRYYGAQAEREFSGPTILPGPTGERNELWLRGRGVFVCIAPWNFPVAIFTGQVAAALAAGNSVVAKPANQTPMCAHLCVTLLHMAGVPAEVLHLLLGSGSALGKVFVESREVAGIAFTGSTGTANHIYRGLAARGAPIIPFIAETGGQNCMVVDSTALLEQATDDILLSAFDSAGQRCSALRVVFVQDDIADRLIKMLCGAAAEWQVGDPRLLSTDIGPVIDRTAMEKLEAHAARMAAEAKIHFTATLPADCANGTFFAPRIVELQDISQLPDEVFGPVLHIIRYKSNTLEAVFQAIDSTGFGLTCGIHSRLDAVHEMARRHVRAGNLYVNRTMVGAVVGVQPFGGEGLSGTGPKAGGPNYLHRFAAERTVSINTTAAGGNASLLGL